MARQTPDPAAAGQGRRTPPPAAVSCSRLLGGGRSKVTEPLQAFERLFETDIRHLVKTSVRLDVCPPDRRSPFLDLAHDKLL